MMLPYFLSHRAKTRSTDELHVETRATNVLLDICECYISTDAALTHLAPERPA